VVTAVAKAAGFGVASGAAEPAPFQKRLRLLGVAPPGSGAFCRAFPAPTRWAKFCAALPGWRGVVRDVLKESRSAGHLHCCSRSAGHL